MYNCATLERSEVSPVMEWVEKIWQTVKEVCEVGKQKIDEIVVWMSTRRDELLRAGKLALARFGVFQKKPPEAPSGPVENFNWVEEFYEKLSPLDSEYHYYVLHAEEVLLSPRAKLKALQKMRQYKATFLLYRKLSGDQQAFEGAIKKVNLLLARIVAIEFEAHDSKSEIKVEDKSRSVGLPVNSKGEVVDRYGIPVNQRPVFEKNGEM